MHSKYYFETELAAHEGTQHTSKRAPCFAFICCICSGCILSIAPASFATRHTIRSVFTRYFHLATNCHCSFTSFTWMQFNNNKYKIGKSCRCRAIRAIHHISHTHTNLGALYSFHLWNYRPSPRHSCLVHNTTYLPIVLNWNSVNHVPIVCVCVSVRPWNIHFITYARNIESLMHCSKCSKLCNAIQPSASFWSVAITSSYDICICNGVFRCNFVRPKQCWESIVTSRP